MSLYSQATPRLMGRGVISQDSVVRRGNLSVLATAEFRGGQMVASPVAKQRYVWPNPYNRSNSGMSSYKLYAR